MNPPPDSTLADPEQNVANLQREIANLQRRQDEAQAREGATAEVLRVIDASPGDLAPIFDAILEKAHYLCGAVYGSLQVFDGEVLRAVAVRGLPHESAHRLKNGCRPDVPGHPFRPLLSGGRFVHVPDIRDVANPVAQAAFNISGIRTSLAAPLRHDDVLLGIIVAGRREVRPFSDKEIALLQNLAAPAVIAMENVRLLGDLRERTDDLRQSLKYQTVISVVWQN